MTSIQNCTQPAVHVDIPPRPTHKIMPDRKEREHWWEFLNGSSESIWNPPKKPKKQNNRNDRYGAGPSRVNTYSYGRDEVDVLDYAVSMDPTESLPTPSGTPAPPDQTGNDQHPKDTPAHAQDNPTAPGSLTVPHPTPTLIRDIDHVRFSPINSTAQPIAHKTRSLLHFSPEIEVCDTPSNVFRTLDQPTPRGCNTAAVAATAATVCRNREARTVDVRAARSCRRLYFRR